MLSILAAGAIRDVSGVHCKVLLSQVLQVNATLKLGSRHCACTAFWCHAFPSNCGPMRPAAFPITTLPRQPRLTDCRPRSKVGIRPTRQEPFVVTAFMRSFAGFRCTAPMNRGTTNGLGDCLRRDVSNPFPDNDLRLLPRIAGTDRGAESSLVWVLPLTSMGKTI